jgi:hypothetical protein
VSASLALIYGQEFSVVLAPIEIENVALMQAGPQPDHERQMQVRVVLDLQHRVDLILRPDPLDARPG